MVTFSSGSTPVSALQVPDLTGTPISTEAFKVHTKIIEQRCVLLDCIIYRNELYFQSSSVAKLYTVLEILISYIFQNLRLQFY